MVTHNSDCSQCDSRVAKIPANEWPDGSMRPIYGAKLEYPREVSVRSQTYEPQEGQSLSVPTGYIPQVRKTYAYWEALYGYMNEHGLALGESTAAANFPVSRTNLSALLWIRPLTEIAMERCRTARCAIKTMGELAERYGFYGEDPGSSGAGECLVIVDGSEVWVFEITGDPTGKSAFWAAYRVPEGNVVAIANNFIIRNVDCHDEENYYCSTGLLDRARAAGAWDGSGSFDWAKAMGPDIRYYSYTAGFPPIPEYTTARLWRVYSLVAPSLGLQRTDNTYAIPISVRPDRRLSVTDVMDLKRDHYEGTDIDLTVGVFAGPFNSPTRLEGGDGMKEYALKHGGQFARPIAMARTSYSTVGQSFGLDNATNKWWFASDSPASSVYVPFYAATSSFAPSYRTGNMNEYDDKSAWWVFDFVANWMELHYSLMNVDVKSKLHELQNFVVQKTQPVDAQLRATPVFDASYLEQVQESIQNYVVNTWRDFGKSLIVKYNDGMLNVDGLPKTTGYPAWWLQMFALDNNIHPKWGQPAPDPPSLWYEVPDVAAAPARAAASKTLALAAAAPAAAAPVLAAFATLAAVVAGAFAAGRSLGRREGSRGCGDGDYRVAPA
eukprot:TRINITY_DN63280_c0_g1_i1.p1 TRINITY_DN63280_c0_g1~~TRINITY_DN63280_c0_g1_i1.p1  ORF type:complete len:657 (-),score=89.82 TRINITY_DN63280_c0_g1_i1:33-1859(-)